MVEKVLYFFSSRFSIWFYIGFAVWTVSFLLPYVILGENCYIRIHDTLEGELVWLELLSRSGLMYSLDGAVEIPELMNGLRRSVLPSGFSFVPNMVHWFGMIKGYILSLYVLKSIGFVSFYMFARRYMHLPNLKEYYLVCVCMLLTSIQFFTPFGLSIVGVPLIALGFARLYYQKSFFTTFLIFFLFPFFSSFVWSGIELILIFLLITIVLIIYFRERLWSWVLAFGAFGLGTLLSNIQLINGLLFTEGFRSHRVIYNTQTDMPNFFRTISDFIGYFFSSHYHVSIFISTIIFGIFLISYYSVEKIKWSRNIVIAIIIISLWQGFYPFIEYLLRDITFIKSFHFNRFGFLLPFLWLTLLMISLDVLSQRRIYARWISLVLLSQFLVLMLANDETAHNYKKLIGQDNFPSYSEYLAHRVFPKIKKELKIQSSDYSISIGMSPTIAQYHGVSCLDGLFSIYDLDYKLRFRKIFSRELDKTDWKRREYFDNWGNRCYIFPAELPLETVSNSLASRDKLKVKNLEIDTEQLKAMGGKYIFSAVEILNFSSLHLKFRGKFGGETDFWNIYVYEV